MTKTTRRAAVWIATAAVTWAGFAWAQQTPAVEETPTDWLGAARELGVPDPIALVARLDLEDGVVGVLAGSSATETGQRELRLVVIRTGTEAGLGSLLLPGVRTPDRSLETLVTARVVTDEGAPPLLMLEIETGPGPTADAAPERRGFVVNLSQVSLTHDYMASEWRQEFDGTWTYFERAPQIVAGEESGRELVLMVDRRNGDGRESRVRQGLHTWP